MKVVDIHLQIMIDASPMGMVLLSRDGTVLCHNVQAKRLLGIDRDFTDVGLLPRQAREVFREVEQSKSNAHVQIKSLRFFFRYVSDRTPSCILLTVMEDPAYQELECIIQESFDEILVTDAEGHITKISSKCEELYGLSAEELIGKKTTELAEQGIFNPTLIPRVLKERKKVSGVQVTRTGKKLYVTGNPVFDEKGNLYRVVFNSREVSEIEALENRLHETEELLDKYRTELHQLRLLGKDRKEIVYQSDKMKQVYLLAAKVAQVDSTVLIVGETGVGKGMMARFIHQESSRRNHRMIEINCGAIPENLIESELFGYERGAFTGANREGKKGVIELADNGTLFLDEIGELPLNVQSKLLHFLQENTFRRVGGSSLIRVNTRIIAATNKDLPQLVKEKKFREDLYYRLNVIPITVPPLRHRKEDIPVLVENFLSRLNQKYQMNKRIGDEVMDAFMNYDWPGNVRELENLIERLVVTAEGNTVTPGDLPDHFLTRTPSHGGVIVKDICPLKEAIEDLERQLVLMAYRKHKNTYKCAEVLKVNQSTVVRKLKKYRRESEI